MNDTTYTGDNNVISDGVFSSVGRNLAFNTTVVNNITTTYIQPEGVAAGDNVNISTSGTSLIVAGGYTGGTIQDIVNTWLGTVSNPFTVVGTTGITTSTSGNVITLLATDVSGTIYGEVSNWMGTVTTPKGVLAGDRITLSTSGNVISFSSIDPSGTALLPIIPTQNRLGFLVGNNISSIATAGNVLTVNGINFGSTAAVSLDLRGTGGVTFSTSGNVISFVSGRQLLATATASTSASIDFTNFKDTARFNHYTVEISNCVVTNDNAHVLLRTSSNAGGTYDAGANDCGVNFLSMYSGNANQGGAAASAAGAYIDNLTANWGLPKSVTAVGEIRVDMYNFGSSNAPKIFNILGQHNQYAATAEMMNAWGMSIRKQCKTVPFDAVRFIPTAGNIRFGVFKLWGWK